MKVQKRMTSKAFEEMKYRDPELEGTIRHHLINNPELMRKKSQDIAAHLNTTDEKVRFAIRALILHWKLPIRSRAKGGFEILKDIQSLQAEVTELRGRADAILARAATLETLTNSFTNQLALDLE